MDILTTSSNEKEHWIKQAQLILEEQELRECSFRPQIITNYAGPPALDSNALQSIDTMLPAANSRAASNAALPPKHSSGSASDAKGKEARAESKPRRARRDRTTEEVEYERAKGECTFRPNLVKKPVTPSKGRKESGTRIRDESV